MMISWIVGCILLILVLCVLYIRHEAIKAQLASVELYFVLSFEPLLVEEVYELARRSGLRSLTQFLGGISLLKLEYLILFKKRTYEPWFHLEHLNVLLGILEDRGLVKITKVPITLAWLEVNQARLWTVPPDRLEYWRSWASLMNRLAQLKSTEAQEAQYQRYQRKTPMAELVQKRPWGRRTPPKEVRLTERSWQGA
jgi:hypothetical protein